MTTEQFDWFNAKVREAGEALLEAQNPSRARDLAGEAYDRATRVLDEDSAAMGATLQLISRIYFRLGDYATARSMALEAKTLAEENLGVRHHMHIDCIEDLAGIEIAEGNEDQASALLAEKTRLLELTHTG
jgi:tetratricopeptide (TPR) repeat protein